MIHPNEYDMPSGKIAKNRLVNMKLNDIEFNKSQNNSTSNTSDYIQNSISIDNNLLWKENHNALSSKGD